MLTRASAYAPERIRECSREHMLPRAYAYARESIFSYAVMLMFICGHADALIPICYPELRGMLPRAYDDGDGDGADETNIATYLSTPVLLFNFDSNFCMMFTTPCKLKKLAF